MISNNTILFNAGGGLALLVVAGYFAHSAMNPERAPVCNAEYSALTELPLGRADGDPGSVAELQARLAGRDLGVLDNSRIVRVNGMQRPVLEVNLPKGSVGPQKSGSNRGGGVAFQWRPSGLSSAAAVCLGYSVWLPENFDFKRGGTLPGVYGAGDRGYDEKAAFAFRYMWRDDGRSELLTTLPGNNGEPRTMTMNPDAFRLPRGKWFRLDQEVVLNTIGQKDGLFRLWTDGQLVVERTGLVLRDSDLVTFAGVLADVYYGGTDSSFAAPQDTLVRLTPFEFRSR